MILETDCRFFLDTTIFVDFFKAVILGIEEYDNIIEFCKKLTEYKVSFETTPIIVLETIKALRCVIFKDKNINDFIKEIKSFKWFIRRFDISISYFDYEKICNIKNILPYILNLCVENKWHAGELSLLVDVKNVDKVIFVSSDNSCFANENLRWYDPRNYKGEDLFTLLENC